MYSTKYILNFSNELDEVYQIYFDYLGYTGVSTNIIGMVDALVLRCTGGDEDRLFPICGTECLMNVLVGTASIKGVVTNDSTLTIYDLIATQDNQIRVTVYKDMVLTKSIFQGFVVVENNSQPFMDPPFNLSIRALDGLGLLKGIDMVDLNGQLYAGILSVQDWIGNIIAKTGQTLNIRYYFPFYPLGSNSVQPALSQVFLDAITWQTGQLITTTDPSIDVAAAEADDSYTVLEKIARCFRVKIFQQDGVWNVVSLYSYVDPNGFAYNECQMTTVSNLIVMKTVATGTAINYDVPVGKEQILHLVNDDATQYLKLATKWIKLSYTYDQSANKVCNQDFSLGNPDITNNGTILSTVEDITLLNPLGQPFTMTYLAYLPFCWTIAGGTTGGGGTVPFPETAQTATCYIRNVQDVYGASQNRYLTLYNATNANHARSSTFLVDMNDIVQVSVDFRTRTDCTGAGITINYFHVLLLGTDGSHWGLGGFGGTGGDTHWILCDANWNMIGSPFPPQNGLSYTPGSGGTNVWGTKAIDKTLAGTINPVPINGTVFINLEGLPTGGGLESWFKNVTITVIPYLQSGYQQLSGDYNYSSSNQAIKQTESDSVEISDSPKRYFKGALLDLNNNLWAPTWHRLGVIEAQRFTQLMERIMYNLLTRMVQKIEGTVRGLSWVDTTYTNRQAGMINRYYFTEHPVPTKKFMLTSFEKDLGTGQGRHVFVEILNDQNDTGFLDPNVVGTYLFQYLFQNSQ